MLTSTILCSDVAWACMHSRAWGGAILLCGALLCFIRPVVWFFATGHGKRNHTIAIFPATLLGYIGALIGTSILYHVLACTRLTAPVQKTFLKKMRRWEAGIAAWGLALVLAVASERFRAAPFDNGSIGSTAQVLGSQVALRATPMSGLIAIPAFVMSAIAALRPKLVPEACGGRETFR